MTPIERQAKQDILAKWKADRDALIEKYPGVCPGWVSTDLALLSHDIRLLEKELSDD